MTDRQYFLRIFGYVKPYKFAYGIGTFFYCIQTFGFTLMNSFFLGAATAAIMNQRLSDLLTSIWVTVSIMLAVMALVGVGAYFMFVTVSYAIKDMSIDVFRSFIRSGAENQIHSGDKTALINTDINIASGVIGDAITPLVQNIISISFSVILATIIDLRMGVGIAVLGGLIFLVQARFAPPLARLGKEQLETNSGLVKAFSNIFAGALTLRAYNRQDSSIIQFDLANGKLRKIAFKQAFIGMWQDMFTTIQGWLVLVLVFALGGWLSISGAMQFSQVMMTLPLAMTVGMAMSLMGTTYAGLQPSIAAAKRIVDVLDSNPIELSETRDANIKADPMTEIGKRQIKIDKLNFAYRGSTENALKDIELNIDENQMVAFVGESGSGKSTLLKTMIGMYERDNLGMEIGGLEFSKKNIHQWRSNFAYVDQNCRLFDASVAENITLGSNRDVNEDQIKEAAKRALAHNFIVGFEDGYATGCGEKGATLSGGQNQRIAIARALYRKAPFLVFDEATASLDTDSERGIMETIESLRADHTILIATHNLDLIKSADKIVVMSQGEVVELGTHDELLNNGGTYKNMLALSQKERTIKL